MFVVLSRASPVHDEAGGKRWRRSRLVESRNPKTVILRVALELEPLHFSLLPPFFQSEKTASDTLRLIFNAASIQLGNRSIYHYPFQVKIVPLSCFDHVYCGSFANES